MDAAAAAYVGLGGVPDLIVWKRAYDESRIVVTVNVSDFINLAKATDLHPGIIALRESGLDRMAQWQRLQEACSYIHKYCEGDLINQVLEVSGIQQLVLHPVPAS